MVGCGLGVSCGRGFGCCCCCDIIDSKSSNIDTNLYPLEVLTIKLRATNNSNLPLTVLSSVTFRTALIPVYNSRLLNLLLSSSSLILKYMISSVFRLMISSVFGADVCVF